MASDGGTSYMANTKNITCLQNNEAAFTGITGTPGGFEAPLISRTCLPHWASALPLHSLLPSIHTPPNPQRPSPGALLPYTRHRCRVKRDRLDAGGAFLFHPLRPGSGVRAVSMRRLRQHPRGFHGWSGRSRHPRIVTWLSWVQRRSTWL